MKRILLNIVLALSLCGLSAYVYASETELPETLLNKEEVQNIQWKNIDAIIKNWPDNPPSKSKDFTDKAVIKSTRIDLNGSEFKAEARKYDVSGRHEITLFGNKFGGNFCHDFSTFLNQKYGKAKLFSDLSMGQKSDASSSIDVRAYWDMKDSRIVFVCYGMNMYGKFVPAIASIQFGSTEDVLPIEEPVLLKCSHTQKLSTKEEATEEPPFSLLIDQELKRLRSESKAIGETSSYSDKQIINKIDNEKTEGSFRLDRLTGTYEWELFLKKTSYSLKSWGNCEKISLDKKF